MRSSPQVAGLCVVDRDDLVALDVGDPLVCAQGAELGLIDAGRVALQGVSVDVRHVCAEGLAVLGRHPSRGIHRIVEDDDEAGPSVGGLRHGHRGEQQAGDEPDGHEEDGESACVGSSENDD